MASSGKHASKDASEVETIAENHLGNQAIRCARHANAEPKIDFPLGRKIQVNGGKDLLLLLANRVKAGDGAERSVIFDAAGDFLAEIVAEFEVRGENEPLIHARTVERPVESRIEREIPFAELPIHNRANLPRPSVRGIAAALPADLIRKADAHGPVPLG